MVLRMTAGFAALLDLSASPPARAVSNVSLLGLRRNRSGKALNLLCRQRVCGNSRSAKPGLPGHGERRPGAPRSGRNDDEDTEDSVPPRLFYGALYLAKGVVRRARPQCRICRHTLWKLLIVGSER